MLIIIIKIDFVSTEELEIFVKYYMSVATSQDEKDCIDYIYNLPVGIYNINKNNPNFSFFLIFIFNKY